MKARAIDGVAGDEKVQAQEAKYSQQVPGPERLGNRPKSAKKGRPKEKKEEEKVTVDWAVRRWKEERANKVEVKRRVLWSQGERRKKMLVLLWWDAYRQELSIPCCRNGGECGSESSGCRNNPCPLGWFMRMMYYFVPPWFLCIFIIICLQHWYWRVVATFCEITAYYYMCG